MRILQLWWLGPLFASAVTLTTVWLLAQPSLAETKDQSKSAPKEVPASGYATSSSCLECHQEQHASWFASFHRTMTQPVTPETAPSVIEDRRVEVDDLVLEFVRQGDDYFVRFDDPLEAGQQISQRKLLMMTGSHHMHVFWCESPIPGIPAIVPVVYLIDEQRWIPRKSSFIRPPSPRHSPELGRWNNACASCHTVDPRQRFERDTQRYDTRVSEFGIACEACHGPGRDHIDHHRGDQSPISTAANDVVVNPQDLPPELRSDVCGQCHSVYLLNRDDLTAFADFLDSGFRFRPGDDVETSQFRKIVKADEQARNTEAFRESASRLDLSATFWSDGAVRVSGREFNGLIQSPCYQNGALSCLSCHQMHPDDKSTLSEWRDDQLKEGMRTNHACTQCHQEAKYNELVTQHTHHGAESSGSDCMNCHMPHTTYGLLKAIRSHQIESPSAVTTVKTQRPTGCNTCHLDKSLGWTADHLSQWYGQPRPELDPMQEELASGVSNLLMGDAGLRALTACLYRWKPAQEASGTRWMAPYLLIGMLDDYDAVRVVSRKSLREVPGWQKVTIDDFGDPQERTDLVSRYLGLVKKQLRLRPSPEVLFGPDGSFDYERASALFRRRDRTPVTLSE